MAYVGWLLPDDERDRLLSLIPPKYADVVAHHVTLKFGVGTDEPLPSETMGEVLGVSDDGEGVQAVVVRVGGTANRPDGGVFHITWSLDREAGRKPVHSNDVIRTHGWLVMPAYVAFRLEPMLFR
jgi:hypothetical protein